MNKKQTNSLNSLKPLLMWFSITLSASVAFLITASQEISQRTFPQSNPLFSDAPINKVFDVFLPAISAPIVLFGIFAGLIVFMGYKWLSYQSNEKGHVVGILAPILLAVMLWFGIQAIVFIIQFKWMTVHNADLLGIGLPAPKYYQLAIWVVGVMVIGCTWLFGRKTTRS
jgi:hypothetical protein